MLSEMVHTKRGMPVMLIAGVLLVGFGILLGRMGVSSRMADTHAASAEKDHGKATTWTCTMHPQIRLPEPGKCPICGMTLIPASEHGGEMLGVRMMNMSEESMHLADVATALVERRFVDLEIPLVGKVDYDERRLKTIAAWVPGRLDRLFVDYTGVPVKAGDHLVEMYSPELFAGQEELLQAIKAVKSLEQSASVIVRRSTEKMVDASREKLRLLGLRPEQIAEIEQRGTASATVQMNAPVGGIVIHKNAKEGTYVQTGTPIYTVADLSMVWVMLDAYESDIAWLRYGQEVEMKTEAYGDRTFTGWISFIDPVLNPQTRTIQVRVIVKNADGMLRPNMFARAVVKVRIADDDRVISRNLRGKWISPMHPEIIKDSPGTCDVCGMPLVKAADFGYVEETDAKAPLVVPASAVLTTGERAIVYVKVPDMKKPTFEGVEVKIGPRAGKDYIVRSGLKEGQEVVTQGNFKIDSALQLLAKPSMMNPSDDDSAHMNVAGQGDKAMANESVMSATEMNLNKSAMSKRLDAPETFLKQLAPMYDAYLKAQQALAADDEKQARAALDQLANAGGDVDMTLLKDHAHMQWMELSRQLMKALEHRRHMSGIEGVRTIFLNVSKPIISLEKTFGHVGDAPHRIAFCPMADDSKGAEWMQTEEDVRNPYYGAAMISCGEIRQTHQGAEASTTESTHDQQ